MCNAVANEGEGEGEGEGKIYEAHNSLLEDESYVQLYFSVRGAFLLYF